MSLEMFWHPSGRKCDTLSKKLKIRFCGGGRNTSSAFPLDPWKKKDCFWWDTIKFFSTFKRFINCFDSNSTFLVVNYCFEFWFLTSKKLQKNTIEILRMRRKKELKSNFRDVLHTMLKSLIFVQKVDFEKLWIFYICKIQPTLIYRK